MSSEVSVVSSSSEKNECDKLDTGEYNMPLHIAAIFIEIGVSFLGTLLPIIGKRSPRLRMSDYTFALAKNFGTGVILATSFIHMLCPAMENLSNECLPKSFRGSYEGWAGLFALLAVLTIQFIQTCAVAHANRKEAAQNTTTEPLLATEAGATPSSARTTVTPGLQVSATIQPHHGHGHGDGEECDHVHTMLLDPHNTAGSGSRRVATYMLELGIATHSVIIGVTLGVARGDEFKGLMVALAFHQFFEGIALSTTVLDSGFKTMAQPIAVVIFYTLTTPIGVAIGVAISSAYNANSVSTLLIQGIFDAVSAGILLYDGLVNMLNNNITHNKGFEALSPVRKGFQFLAFWLGAAVMAIIGRWA